MPKVKAFTTIDHADRRLACNRPTTSTAGTTSPDLTPQPSKAPRKTAPSKAKPSEKIPQLQHRLDQERRTSSNSKTSKQHADKKIKINKKKTHREHLVNARSNHVLREARLYQLLLESSIPLLLLLLPLQLRRRFYPSPLGGLGSLPSSPPSTIKGKKNPKTGHDSFRMKCHDSTRHHRRLTSREVAIVS